MRVVVRGAPPAGFPVEPNTTARVEGKLVVWLGPDEWVVLGGAEADFAEAAAAVDVSANWVAFELRGPDVELVLARSCSLDLHESIFAAGRCAQTLLADVPVILYRPAADAFRLLVRPSFAPHLRRRLVEDLATPTAATARARPGA